MKPPDELFKSEQPVKLPPLNPRPDYYNDILIFGGRGAAEIGGWLQTPNLSLSYLLAARYTIEGGLARGRLSEVAMPAAYLQRHAVEVELKAIIGTARGIWQDRSWWDLLDEDEQAEAPTVKQPSSVHDFEILVAEAATALKAIDFDELPKALLEMCKKLTNLEKREEAGKPDATRMRYLRDKKGGRQFPERQELPLIKHQNELEALFADLVHVHGKPDDPNQNWVTRLVWRGEFAEQPLTNRLYQLGRLDE